jgi:hypothetical protein
VPSHTVRVCAAVLTASSCQIVRYATRCTRKGTEVSRPFGPPCTGWRAPRLRHDCCRTMGYQVRAGRAAIGSRRAPRHTDGFRSNGRESWLGRTASYQLHSQLWFLRTELALLRTATLDAAPSVPCLQRVTHDPLPSDCLKATHIARTGTSSAVGRAGRCRCNSPSYAIHMTSPSYCPKLYYCNKTAHCCKSLISLSSSHLNVIFLKSNFTFRHSSLLHS